MTSSNLVKACAVFYCQYFKCYNSKLPCCKVHGTCKNHYPRICLHLLLIMHLYFVFIECKNCSSKLHLLMNQHLFYGSLGAPYGRLDGVQGPQAVQRVPMVECQVSQIQKVHQSPITIWDLFVHPKMTLMYDTMALGEER